MSLPVPPASATKAPEKPKIDVKLLDQQLADLDSDELDSDEEFHSGGCGCCASQVGTIGQ